MYKRSKINPKSLILVWCTTVLLLLSCQFGVVKSSSNSSEISSSTSKTTAGANSANSNLEAESEVGNSSGGEAINNAEEEEEEEAPSLLGLFSGLLETLTETKEVKDCPGQCVNVYRALICETTLENSACPGNMKCCVENSSNETDTNRHPPPQYKQPPPPPHWNNKPNWHYNNYPPNYNGPPPNYNGQPYPPYRGPPPQQYSNSGPPPQQFQGQGQPVWQNQIAPTQNNNNWVGPGPGPAPSNNVHYQTPSPPQDSTTPGTIVTPEVNKQGPEVNSGNLGKNDGINGEEEDDEIEEMEQILATNTKPHISHHDSITESNKLAAQICPGSCVAQRMFDLCDGTIINQNVCPSNLKCCISHEYYSNNYKTNPNLILLKPNTEMVDLSALQDDELDEAAAAAAAFAATSTIAPTTTTVPPRPPATTISSKSKLSNCPGTCMTPILTMFCQSVNKNYRCDNDNVCCINGTDESTSSMEKTQGGYSGQNNNQNVRVQDDICRVCLPNNLHSKCQQVLPLNCMDGYFCCISPPPNAFPVHPGTGQMLYPPPQQGPPHSGMYPGPQHNYGPGPGYMTGHPMNQIQNPNHNIPPPQGKPPRPVQTYPKQPPFGRNQTNNMIEKNTISTTMKADEEDWEDEPESEESSAANEKLLNCPGSCINSILSFTCFKNAEITDLFLCPKANTKCCAPKTAVKDYLDSINATTTTIAPIQTEKVLKSQISSKTPVQINHFPQQQPTPPPQMQNPHQYNLYQPQSQPTILLPQQPNIISKNNPSSISQLQPPLPPNSHYQQQPQPVNPPPYIPSGHSHKPVVILPQPKPQINALSKIPNFNKYICGVKGNMNQQSEVGHSGGNVRVKRVVGGDDSEPGEWCWQIALINNLNQYLCGGALIGTQWVLTAAHCVTNIIRSGDTIYVRVGDYDLTSKYGSPGAQTLKVQTTYIHHNHNSQTLDNDIALLKLQGQISLKEGVCLVCLPARSGSNNELYNSNKKCTVTGYGYMGESGPIPLRIREANLPIVPESECIRKINAVTEKIFVLPTSSFCAGGELKNDACQGDGGGPLVCMDNGFYELTGLVSWGFGCGRENVPGVYVKVSSFIGWINQIISVNN